jgi:hypothetical protein
MSKLQKFAVFNLILSSVGLTIQIVILLSNNLLFKAIASIIAIFIFAPIFVSYLLRRKYKKQGSKYFDERDKLIHKKAAFVGFFTMSLTLSFVVLITFIIIGPLNSIPINALLPILILSLLSINFAESIAILIQYNWSSDNGK